MSKLTVEFEITGLKLKITGTHDQVPTAGQNLTRQLTALLAPAAAPIDGKIIPPPVNGHETASPPPVSPRKSGKVRKSGSKEPKQPINWTYDGQAHGMPQQGWSTADKGMWLLYVGEKTSAAAQMKTVQITNTFNEHYRSAKQINKGNVGRDLDKARLLPTPLVDKNENGWFVTQEGHKHVEKLIGTPEQTEAVRNWA